MTAINAVMPSVAALVLSSGGFNFFPYPLTFLLKPSKIAANSTFKGGRMLKIVKVISWSAVAITVVGCLLTGVVFIALRHDC